MLYFDKEKTEVIFFDIEYYVPPKDRTIIGPSLVASPFKENQFILGGVFTKYNPFKMKNTDYVHFWIWKDIDEKRVLEKIYRYIQSSWEQLTKYKHTLLEQWEEGLICNMQWQADLMFCGIGISQFDIPMLYFRSQHHQIASAEELFNCYFKARALDLNTITIPFFNKDEIMYPKPTNATTAGLVLKKKKIWKKCLDDVRAEKIS
jgi:hypothetical protein